LPLYYPPSSLPLSNKKGGGENLLGSKKSLKHTHTKYNTVISNIYIYISIRFKGGGGAWSELPPPFSLERERERRETKRRTKVYKQVKHNEKYRKCNDKKTLLNYLKKNFVKPTITKSRKAS
jgi:hypothetical protein